MVATQISGYPGSSSGHPDVFNMMITLSMFAGFSFLPEAWFSLEQPTAL